MIAAVYARKSTGGGQPVKDPKDMTPDELREFEKLLTTYQNAAHKEISEALSRHAEQFPGVDARILSYSFRTALEKKGEEILKFWKVASAAAGFDQDAFKFLFDLGKMKPPQDTPEPPKETGGKT